MFLRRAKVNRVLKLILFSRESFPKRYSTLFYRKDVFWKLSEILNIFRKPFSSSYQEVDVLSGYDVFKREKIPSEIRMDKGGRLIVSGELISTLDESQREHVLNKFNLKKLKPQYLDKYNVMLSYNQNLLYFPLNGRTGNVVAVQYLNSSGGTETCKEDIFPCETDLVLFGWPVKSVKQDTLVITSNPVDAVAANQETNIPAIAMSFKNNAFVSQLFDLLEQFQKIILWLHSDHHNWKIHKLFVENVGKQAFFIRPENWLTPLMCLEKGLNLQHILTEAYPLKHEAVETFSAYKKEICNAFKNYEKCAGVKWKRYHVLNELLKGLRPGELTIFSGQTGTGKTTFMSEYSLDLCMQGVPTLWGSFEITNPRLIQTMLTQFSLCSLKDNPEKVPFFASEFNSLPMFFMSFNGNHTLKYVIEAMSHTVIVHGIQHAVIDNLQFMMNAEDFSSTVDNIRRQDQIFSAFRKFATQHSCHITLVMHPRKEPEFTELNNTSISGSAKAVQEADNIIILQTTKMRQYLQVTKNRFDGEKGCVLLEFDKKTLAFKVRKISNDYKSKK